MYKQVVKLCIRYNNSFLDIAYDTKKLYVVLIINSITHYYI